MNFIEIFNIFNSDVAFDFDRKSHFESLQLFSKYYQEYYKEKFMDLSFSVVNENKVLGYVLCSAMDGKLTSPDGGIIISLFKQKTSIEEKQIISEILDYLKSLSKLYHCNSIIIKDFFQEGALSPLGELLFNLKFHARLTFEMEVNYHDFNAGKFRSSIRKSYKSLINWGKKELRIIYVNKSNVNFEYLKNYQLFHKKISGRQTRSDESWDIQYQLIKEGYGELILAEYKDNLVAGALFGDYGDMSIYFTGVYERELFDFGLSHFLVFDGICRSFERKNTSKFSLGYFNTDIKDNKFHNIQFFKKGFCKDFKPTIFWEKEIIL